MNYSDLRGQDRIPLAQAAPLPNPLTLYIEPTNVCNFRCTMCPESFHDFHERSGGRFKLTMEDFELIASRIDQPVKVINFYMMGEPLVNKLTPLFIAKASEYELAERLILTTNASLLTEQASEQLLHSGLDYLRVSIYGADQQQFTEVTGSSMPLKHIRDNIARFYAMRGIYDLKAPRIYVKMLDSGEERNREFLQMFSVADEVAIEPLMNWNDDFEGTIGRPAVGSKRCCPMPFYTLVIHADLRVSVCCVDWNKRLLVGDLRQQSLADIWHGERLLAIQMAHLEGRRGELPGCSTCTYLHTLPDDLDGLTAGEFLKRR